MYITIFDAADTIFCIFKPTPSVSCSPPHWILLPPIAYDASSKVDGHNSFLLCIRSMELLNVKQQELRRFLIVSENVNIYTSMRHFKNRLSV